ncbi:MAG: serine/threonine-protein kinase [Vicinamibacteraceae bacterium]
MAGPPATIGRYELRERIAHGGMGVLYLAFDPVTEREVALKVLRVDSDDLRERFLREARLAARLQHPNIVTIYDVGAHEDQPFIAMEFIAGETLGELVHRRAPLALSRRIALMEQVCVGLAYAHRHGIVHRDVKPANLMISRDSGVLKVLDFGVAGRVDADPGTQMLMGTPNYMSPEQVVGQPSDHRSDIFSVGLVLYELLTYRQAFSGESQQSILLKVLNESPQPLAALVPGIDPSLPAIVDRALEKSVDRRYPDLEAMRSDLSRVGQRVVAAETSHDLVGRGTVAARGRGRAGRVPLRRPEPPPAAPETAVEPIPGSLSDSLSGSLSGAIGSAVAAPGAGAGAAARARTLESDAAAALAAAERDAYEGRFAAAIRRLEAIGPHPEIDGALRHYRQQVAARDAARAQGGARVITDVIRAHVGGVRAALSAGRWREAQELLRTLEREVPAPDDPGTPADPATTAPATAHDGPPFDGFAEHEPPPMRRDDEVAHYLSRARRRLEAGDVPAAQSLLDAALDVTRTP